ncbi:hypothetical protein [Pseudomonas violetae]|uniref:Uncharacterized protein n=1 Tax=Pseudomonas violetae TaxID=2915813 RepID=A0ABT0EZR3_9PSED|nr:hypothetical protein [Pseudomonas violetae]MCK1791224.1 hypothetical protein [Pseudomonas violetae]
MAKPPIKPTVSPQPSTSNTPHRTPLPGDTIGGTNPGRPGSPPRDGSPKPGSSGTGIPGDTTRQPVVVTDMPSGSTRPSVTLGAMITWPREQVDQLLRIGETGLFMSKDQELYADMGRVGIGRVEPDANGNYQVHLSQAPGRSGTTLRKVEDRPTWQIVPALAFPAGSTSATDRPPVRLVNPQVAQRLPAANESGIRWHNLRSYVDLINEGVVQVARNPQGVYQATHGQEWAPSGPLLERIAQTPLWQRKAVDTDVIPDKRPRLEGADQTAAPGKPVEMDFSLSTSHPASTNPYLWVSWGKIEKPVATTSIQIEELHYQVFPDGGKKSQFITYLQPPEFTATHYESFEQLLHTQPWLQPVPVLLTNEGQWAVDASHRMFDKPMVQSVAESFADFSPITSRAVARKLYEVSGDGNSMNRDSLYDISLTLRHWKEQAGIFDPDFENPIDLLPVAPRESRPGNVIKMAPAAVGDSLYRLDFAPVHFKKEWDAYMADPSDQGLKVLVGTVLIRNGYDVFPIQSLHQHPKLVFKRPDHDRIYFLKLGVSNKDVISVNPTPVPELSNPLLPAQIGVDAVLELSAANARSKVTWLLGGVQTTSTGWQSVFIMKER